MKVIHKSLIYSSLFLLWSSVSQAACTLGDLRGTWFVEGVGGNVSGHCKLIFDANGALVTGPKGSACTYDDPGSFVAVTVRASGKLDLADTNTCGFAGNLSIGGKKLSTTSLRLRMSANKEVLAASGPVIATTMVSQYRGDAVVVFTAVKQKP